MFPTSGFFRSNNCPYYLSGLCERPYCHFRHMKQEERPRPAHQLLKSSKNCSRQPSHAHQASRPSRQSSQSSESEAGADASAGDYTPTPLNVLRRTKAQPEQQHPQPPPPQAQPTSTASSIEPSYEPTPLVSSSSSALSTAASSSTSATTTLRRRPLQLPAPKSDQGSGGGEAAANKNDNDDDEAAIYDPIADADAGPSKRSRRHSPSPSPPVAPTAVVVDYEPTPISGGGGGGYGGDDDDYGGTLEEDDDDEYCPTAKASGKDVDAADGATSAEDVSGSGGSGGGKINRVYLDLFGEEPAESLSSSSSSKTEAPRQAAPAPSAASSSSSPSGSGVSSKGIGRLTPSEQLARRAQQAVVNPAALQAQGKVRAPVVATAQTRLQPPPPATPLAGTVANKIPDLVRQRYLDRLAEECRLARPVASASGAGDDQAAATAAGVVKRAQQLELECYERSANRNVYLNAVIMAIKRVRESASQQQQQEGGGGKKRVSSAGDLSDKRLHKHLMRYALTPSQLVENRFPPHLPPLPYPQPANPLERLCVRCGATFLLQRPQLSTPPGQCCYHYGRAYSQRVPGAGFQNIYSCCGGDLQAKGCSLGERHVHEYNVYCDTEGYRETPQPDKATVPKKHRLAVYALDCEMVYTDAGKELARVTMIDRSLGVVYDRIVQPSAPVVDCNTRFSGLREEQLAAADHRLADVQDELLGMLYSTCILVGHSLESDLQVLKLRHSTVVDTSVVFPHRQGPPKKRALRTLASELLNKVIQTGGDAGHDSSEDARTCMELMLNKVTEDLKKGKH